jgi:hypothetical protein
MKKVWNALVLVLWIATLVLLGGIYQKLDLVGWDVFNTRLNSKATNEVLDEMATKIHVLNELARQDDVVGAIVKDNHLLYIHKSGRLSQEDNKNHLRAMGFNKSSFSRLQSVLLHADLSSPEAAFASGKHLGHENYDLSAPDRNRVQEWLNLHGGIANFLKERGATPQTLKDFGRGVAAAWAEVTQ